jgi:hypothetical protein
LKDKSENTNLAKSQSLQKNNPPKEMQPLSKEILFPSKEMQPSLKDAKEMLSPSKEMLSPSKEMQPSSKDAKEMLSPSKEMQAIYNYMHKIKGQKKQLFNILETVFKKGLCWFCV